MGAYGGWGGWISGRRRGRGRQQLAAQVLARGARRRGRRGRARRRSVLPIRPSLITRIRSASAIASSTSWVTSSIAAPCRCCSWRTRSCMCSRVIASSAANGSSSSTRSGSATSARASDDPLGLAAGQRLGPGVRALGRARPRRARRAARSSASVPYSPIVTLREHRLPRQQPVALEDDRPLRGTSTVPPSGRSSPAEQPQQGALAAAGRAQQDDELGLADRQVQVVEDGAVAEPSDRPCVTSTAGRRSRCS